MNSQTYKQTAQTDLVNKLRFQTPYFLFNPEEVINSIKTYQKSFGASIYYAMKANSEPEVLKLIKDQGLGFEVASAYELRFLKRMKTSPQKIIYGTSIKPAAHIREFVRYGVDRFAFDSEQELQKLAKNAPGSRVYVRVLVDDDANSIFTMSEKFGVEPKKAIELLLKAKELNLIPYGISFNVGSQARNPKAWANGVASLLPYIELLSKKGINLQMLDLGGGFPQKYFNDDGIATVETIGAYTIKESNKLPKNLEIIIEPGRGIVAESMALVVTVIAKIKRTNGYWLYLDGGAYNALLEAMEYQGTTRYRISLHSKHHSEKSKQDFILTGPTGDNLDIITKSEKLPVNVDIGDKLVVSDVGAYSTVLTTPFNGFPKPKLHRI